MPEVVRSRDTTVFFYGERQTVSVSPAMVQGGWPGGQGVQWASSVVDERLVTYSRGLFGGFLVWGSDELGDDFASSTRQQTTYAYATMFSGGCLLSTVAFERYTYASRIGGGPFVSLVYTANDSLYFSLRGLWTKEDELTLSGDPLAPCFFVGFVAQTPSLLNQNRLGVQTSL